MPAQFTWTECYVTVINAFVPAQKKCKKYFINLYQLYNLNKLGEALIKAPLSDSVSYHIYINITNIATFSVLYM